MSINTNMGQNIYNDPYDGSKPSTIGNQLRLDEVLYQSIIEIRDEFYFTKMASSKNQPKHYGKKLKRMRYYPIMDDRNTSDQGIDASGVVNTDLAKLYGSSRDISNVLAKLPSLTEYGGLVNRVGMTRVEIESEMFQYGFYQQITQAALDFDTDPDLWGHMIQEHQRAAIEQYEDHLCADLINNAGIVRYAGAATAPDEIDQDCIPKYADFMSLAKSLKKNKASKQVKMLSGSNFTDTKVVASGWVMYAHEDMEQSLSNVEDENGKVRFIPVEHYGSQMKTVSDDEIGTIGKFHIVVPPRMLFDEGKGADIESDTTTYSSNGKFNVYSLLAVGSDSFNTIGFVHSSNQNKYQMIIRPPSAANATFNGDPYGLNGFISIQYWYGTLFTHPEWIGVIKCAGRLEGQQ